MLCEEVGRRAGMAHRKAVERVDASSPSEPIAIPGAGAGNDTHEHLFEWNSMGSTPEEAEHQSVTPL